MMNTKLFMNLNFTSMATAVAALTLFSGIIPPQAADVTSRKRYAQLKNCKIVMADKARHFIMLDDPQWFYGQLDGFLTSRAAK